MREAMTIFFTGLWCQDKHPADVVKPIPNQKTGSVPTKTMARASMAKFRMRKANAATPIRINIATHCNVSPRRGTCNTAARARYSTHARSHVVDVSVLALPVSAVLGTSGACYGDRCWNVVEYDAEASGVGQIATGW